MTSSPAVALFLFVAACLCVCGESGKILVYPLDGSHWINMDKILQSLHSRGHQITVIRSSTSWYISESSPYYTSITVTQDQPQNIESQDTMTNFLRQSLEIRRHEGTLWGFFSFYQHFFDFIEESQKGVADLTVKIFENNTLMREMNQTGYDLCLTDPAFPAGVLLAHHLKLPLVLNVRWVVSGEAHFSIAPSPLSFIPATFSHFTDRMDFFQRVKNVIYKAMMDYMYYFVSGPPYQLLCDRYFGGDVNVMSLMQGADLWLLRTDFTFDFPRPTMPNVVYIGGFQGRPAKPLSKDLEAFMQSSGKHGVIVMTLGTLLSDLGPDISETIAAAFANLPQKIVWRHVGERPANLANNTLLVEWLPQNDILGHPKTKLFVAHGGTNGVYEALYHGVPILGIPLIFDQVDNVIRMKARGVAEMVDILTMDVESLTNALKNILDPAQPYKKNMDRLSKIHHDTPMTPMDSAMFWIEYVMRHKGAAHLRTESYKMPWYAYYCVDVMVVFALCGLGVVASFLLLCRCLIRCLTKTDKSKME